ncbi:MAG: ABC transporter ATP-binding protein [Candidatus Gallimonas sp.]
MRDENNIVEIDGLKTCFFTDSGTVMSVNGVSFDIPKNKIVGVVGESGCGKSVTSLSIMQLVQAPQGQIVEGAIRFATQDYKRDEKGKPIPVWEYEEKDGERVVKTAPVLDKKGNPVLDKEGNPAMKNVQAKDENGLPLFETEDKTYDITKMPTQELYRIRGKDITMIFQEPMTSLNPVFTVGYQLDEVSFLHTPGISKKDARDYSIEMLRKVGISMPEHTYESYPHELSGGMRQRVMIAMAIAGNPKLIIADEPTTALDVTIQAQILELLRDLQRKQGCSIMLITHDLGVIAEMADEVVVMYAGKVIEKGTVQDIFHHPMHPYTVGLQKSKPLIESDSHEPLYSIPGQVPNPINLPDCCYFKNRCNRCTEACKGPYPEMIRVSDTHYVSCYLYREQGN